MRKPRIHVNGGVYHVMIRGNNRQKIFNEPNDDDIFLWCIETTIARYDARVHAYCLMPNHVHLVVETGRESISKIMQLITGRYAQIFNKKYSRKGHLYQERFKSIMINNDRYFLTVIRYIHQNPLRAKLIKTLDDPWPSSFDDYVCDKKKSWLTTKLAWKYFKHTSGNSKKEFKKFMAELQNTEEYNYLFRVNALPEHQPSSDFTKIEYAAESGCVKKPLCTTEDIIVFCEEYFKVSRNVFIGQQRVKSCAFARNMTLALAFITKTASLKELSATFNLSYTYISHQINQTLQSNKKCLDELKVKLIKNFKL